MRKAQFAALELPELGDLVEEVELDSGEGLQLIEPLDSRSEAETAHVAGEGRLPALRRSDLADARVLGDLPDPVDEAERVAEVLPAGLEHRTLRRSLELAEQRHVKPLTHGAELQVMIPLRDDQRPSAAHLCPLSSDSPLCVTVLLSPDLFPDVRDPVFSCAL